ncbi:MAG: hypothetical protein HUJ30_08775 [Gammaproteobacteria bacterium]|nr:hypothetical protein [Gammaproteobacteria bacterium]
METIQNKLTDSLEMIVSMTDQADSASLAEQFVVHISKIFAPKSIILISKSDDVPMKQMALTEKNILQLAKEIQIIEKDASIEAIPAELQAKPIVNIQDKVQWLQLPINSSSGVIGFLQVAGSHPGENIELAEAIIRTFVNMTILLDKK